LLRATEGGYEARALDIHRVFGMLVPAVTVGTLYFQKFAYKEGGRAAMGWLYRGVLGVNFVLLAVAGHYGGNLTHGSKYLFQNAPEFMRTWLDETPEPGLATAAPGSGPGERLYVTTIQGIFANKCVSCHGSEKQKGKYRMDVPEVALAGGSSGRVAIKPGDPFASDLLRRVLLPSTHDDAMPPDGKEPLNGAEIQALVQWIQLGAPFPAQSPAARPGAWQGSNATQRPHP
jgi:mono/diheme cytochrome c family protein